MNSLATVFLLPFVFFVQIRSFLCRSVLLRLRTNFERRTYFVYSLFIFDSDILIAQSFFNCNTFFVKVLWSGCYDSQSIVIDRQCASQLAYIDWIWQSNCEAVTPPTSNRQPWNGSKGAQHRVCERAVWSICESLDSEYEGLQNCGSCRRQRSNS